MDNDTFSIIEIGSTNTKTHIYENNNLIYENNTTIEFKKNYVNYGKIIDSNLSELFKVIEKSREYTNNINILGCSIFRNINEKDLEKINIELMNRSGVKIDVVSQEDEAYFTALGCYGDIDYNGKICVFIGGGGSIELIFIDNMEIVDSMYYNFGVVDITKKFSSLKDDIPRCTFDEIYSYVDDLIGIIDNKAEILVLAGGDHLYWYNNAKYDLVENTIYKNEKQKYMLTIEMSDLYDRDALTTSLDKIRKRSDNPTWFDGSRAMKTITNLIAHKINAKYIIPTSINMEDGIRISKKI